MADIKVVCEPSDHPRIVGERLNVEWINSVGEKMVRNKKIAWIVTDQQFPVTILQLSEETV